VLLNWIAVLLWEYFASFQLECECVNSNVGSVSVLKTRSKVNRSNPKFKFQWLLAYWKPKIRSHNFSDVGVWTESFRWWRFYNIIQLNYVYDGVWLVTGRQQWGFKPIKRPPCKIFISGWMNNKFSCGTWYSDLPRCFVSTLHYMSVVVLISCSLMLQLASSIFIAFM